MENDSKFYFAVMDSTEYVGTKDKMSRIWINYKKDILKDGTIFVDPKSNWTYFPEGISLKDYYFHTSKADDDHAMPYDYRKFSKKFSKDPKTALLNILNDDNPRGSKYLSEQEILKNIKVSDDKTMFTFEAFYTLDYHLALPKHLKKFEDGEYQLVKIVSEIQVFSSTPEMQETIKSLNI